MAQLISFYTHVHRRGIPRKTHLKSNICVRCRAVFSTHVWGKWGSLLFAN